MEREAGILELLQPQEGAGERLREENTRFPELLRKEMPRRQQLELAERALERLESRDYSEEARREVARMMATILTPYLDYRAVALIDFLLDPCPQAADELRTLFEERVEQLESSLMRSSITDPFEVIERSFGLGIKELARIHAVREDTVRRWRRLGPRGSQYHHILSLAEAAEWLHRAGLDEKEMRQWLSTPQPRFPEGISPSEYLRWDGLRCAYRIGVAAAEYYRQKRRQKDS